MLKTPVASDKLVNPMVRDRLVSQDAVAQTETRNEPKHSFLCMVSGVKVLLVKPTGAHSGHYRCSIQLSAVLFPE